MFPSLNAKDSGSLIEVTMIKVSRATTGWQIDSTAGSCPPLLGQLHSKEVMLQERGGGVQCSTKATVTVLQTLARM